MEKHYVFSAPGRTEIAGNHTDHQRGRVLAALHGGGFAGTVQAFVPLDCLKTFKSRVKAVLGENACHVLDIRKNGGTWVK